MGEDIPLGIGMEQLFKILRALALLSPGKKRGKLLASVETGVCPYPSIRQPGMEGSRSPSKIIKVTP